jgi:hypothetical protein
MTSTSMVAEAGPGAQALIKEARRRQRRRYAAIGVVAGVVLAAVATTVAVISATTTGARTVSQNPSGAGTATQSYRFTMTAATSEFVSGMQSVPQTFSGIFDPARRTGEETETSDSNAPLLPATSPARSAGQKYHTVIQVYSGRYVYVRVNARKGSPFYGKHWIRWLSLPYPSGSFGAGLNAPLEMTFLDMLGTRQPNVLIVLAGSPTNPLVSSSHDLLAALRSVGHVRKIGRSSGPGWTGTRYGFTANRVGVKQSGCGLDLSLTGTVDVDQQGRVRAIEDTLSDSHSPSTCGLKPISPFLQWIHLQWTVTMTFSDFGVPVHTTAPPASETACMAKFLRCPRS